MPHRPMTQPRLTCQVRRKRSPICQLMQALKRAQSLACIGWNVSHPHLLPRARALATFCHVIGQTQLTSAQKQQAPGQACTGCAIACCPCLALLIGQHVSALACHLALYLRQFIQNQQAIAVLCSYCLQCVIGGSPALHVVLTTVDTGRQPQRRGLAARAIAPQVKPTAFHASRAQQWPGKCTRHRKHQAAVARTQTAYAVRPVLSITTNTKGVFHLVV